MLRNDRRERRVHFTAFLPYLMHCSASPRLLQNHTTRSAGGRLVTINPTSGVNLVVVICAAVAHREILDQGFIRWYSACCPEPADHGIP